MDRRAEHRGVSPDSDGESDMGYDWATPPDMGVPFGGNGPAHREPSGAGGRAGGGVVFGRPGSVGGRAGGGVVMGRPGSVGDTGEDGGKDDSGLSAGSALKIGAAAIPALAAMVLGQPVTTWRNKEDAKALTARTPGEMRRIKNKVASI